jgi:hypothetical protein
MGRLGGVCQNPLSEAAQCWRAGLRQTRSVMRRNVGVRGFAKLGQ